ncbi:Uncharacterized protein PECH_006269 [Penicillium ucsense]|uniref:Uncharacterized protein n=1 Tax=Penicillium ucsense TaxID=2839758 RepID=A0A8J8W8S8_9EURO|nr:Uncharacterized protein PECM_000313 [Penicillium ucsense]KAF7739069.1 Uncharacterized protein PECH_006269 [Penicillium ucsense]
MAFQVPTQAPRRASHSPPQRPPSLGLPSPSSTPQDEDSTQWVLFAPTARTHTTSTEHTRTIGASRLSDFGSFGTATRSAVEHDGDHAIADDEDVLEDHFDEDGTELDSLDDGLHAFRAPSLPAGSPSSPDQGPPAMLPAHDGLGSFQASSPVAQAQLWQHEQYNPLRQQTGTQPRRRASIQRHVDTVNEQDSLMDRERWQRIEQWRMDQSRALLQEIERETRRQRRSSRASMSAVPRSVESTPLAATPKSSVKIDPSSTEAVAEIDESFWRRITRKVIEDLIGIDDTLLSVILGETLLVEVPSVDKDSPPLDMETVLAREPELPQTEAPLWQSRVIQRIAHELGILVHQLCEHPGAFTSYFELTKDISGEYAGMPLNRLADSTSIKKSSESANVPRPPSDEALAAESIASLQFHPTLGDPNPDHEAQWGIEDEDPVGGASVAESARLQQEQEYWERGLDVMMVFRYLRSRFSRRGYMSGEKHTATPSPPRHTQDASRRAAIIRQHHPLVARAHTRSQTQTRRPSHISGVSGCAALPVPLTRQHLRRPGSSCASQSKLSGVSSHRTLTGSSRNYWDIGGSVDSNSAIGVGAGLGTWAEA